MPRLMFSDGGSVPQGFGLPGDPVSVTKENIVQIVTDCAKLLEEQSVVHDVAPLSWGSLFELIPDPKLMRTAHSRHKQRRLCRRHKQLMEAWMDHCGVEWRRKVDEDIMRAVMYGSDTHPHMTHAAFDGGDQ